MAHQTPFPVARTRQTFRGLWLLAILVVIIGSLLPGNSAPIQALERLRIGDKIEHFVAYALLAFLPAIHERRGFITVATFGMLALGVGLEFGQLYSCWRDFDVRDMVADTAGICIGLTIGVSTRPIFRSIFADLRH